MNLSDGQRPLAQIVHRNPASRSALTQAASRGRSCAIEGAGKTDSASTASALFLPTGRTRSRPSRTHRRPSMPTEPGFLRGVPGAGSMPGRAPMRAMRRLGTSCSITAGGDTSDQFQFVACDLHCHRALDAFDRNQQAFLFFLFENAFQAVQAATSDPHPSSHGQKGMQGARYLLR